MDDQEQETQDILRVIGLLFPGLNILIRLYSQSDGQPLRGAQICHVVKAPAAVVLRFAVQPESPLVKRPSLPLYDLFQHRGGLFLPGIEIPGPGIPILYPVGEHFPQAVFCKLGKVHRQFAEDIEKPDDHDDEQEDL